MNTKRELAWDPTFESGWKRARAGFWIIGPNMSPDRALRERTILMRGPRAAVDDGDYQLHPAAGDLYLSPLNGSLDCTQGDFTVWCIHWIHRGGRCGRPKF